MNEYLWKRKLDNRERFLTDPYGDADGFVDYLPVKIQIEHTTHCNGACVMCFHSLTGNRGASHMSLDVVRRLEPVFPTATNVQLNGFGECFLYPHLREAVEIYRKYDVLVGTNTSLCQIPDDMFTIIDENFDHLTISCDAVTEDTFRKIRRGLDYSTFMDKFERLMVTSPHVRKFIEAVMMAENVEELPDIIEFSNSIGISHVTFSHLNFHPLLQQEKDSLLNYPNAMNYHLKIARDKARRYNIEMTVPDYVTFEYDDDGLALEMDIIRGFDRESLERRFQDIRERHGMLHMVGVAPHDELSPRDMLLGIEHRPNNRCAFPMETLTVEANGNVSLCCHMLNTTNIGNIMLADGFDDVWNGANYRLLRRLFSRSLFPMVCHECTTYELRDPK